MKASHDHKAYPGLSFRELGTRCSDGEEEFGTTIGLCLPPRFLARGRRRGLTGNCRERSFFGRFNEFELEEDERDPRERELETEPVLGDVVT